VSIILKFKKRRKNSPDDLGNEDGLNKIDKMFIIADTG